MTDSETTRRSMMLGAGGAGLAVVLTACGGTDSAAPADGGSSASQPAPASSAAEGSGASGSGGEANVLAKTADIPKGGGKVFKEQKVVVIQTSDGQFKAFSAICPHQGCTCNAVSNGTINCPCHGSKFSIDDGSVTAGPAKQPLEEKQIKVDGDSISLA